MQTVNRALAGHPFPRRECWVSDVLRSISVDLVFCRCDAFDVQSSIFDARALIYLTRSRFFLGSEIVKIKSLNIGN